MSRLNLCANLKTTFFGLALVSVMVILYQIYSQTAGPVSGSWSETQENTVSYKETEVSRTLLTKNESSGLETLTKELSHDETLTKESPIGLGNDETLTKESPIGLGNDETLTKESPIGLGNDESLTDTEPVLSNGGTTAADINNRPNIVYLLVDDVGYGDVAYNGGVAKTQNLDEMASSPHSIHFHRFYSGGPTCSPTRGTLLTGRNHNRYCIWHADLGVPLHDLTCPSLMPLPPSELTVAEVLSEVGYHTAIYGKWHVGDLKEIKGGNKKWPVSNPTMHGFREWLVTERHTSNILSNCKCSRDFACKLDGLGYNIAFCREYWYENPLTGKLEKSKRQIFEDSHYLVDRFEDFLKNRNKSRPFYWQLSFHSVHSQYLATPFWREIYKKKYNDNKSNYLGAMSALDEAVGRVRHLLREHGIEENTLLWFSSDNGPQNGEPGSAGKLRGRKGDVYEGGIRVPGIIEWPAVIHQNRKTSVPVVTTDFLPTIAEIVGYTLPSDRIIDGISILPILNDASGERLRGSNIKYAFHVKKGRTDLPFNGAVVGDRYKFYAQFDKGRMENYYLYDLETDIGESRNVSEDHVQLTLTMKAELEEFLKSFTESATEIGCLETHDRRYVKCR